MIAVKTLAAITGLAFGAAAPELPTVGEVLKQARSAAGRAPSLVGVSVGASAVRPAAAASCAVPQLDGAKISGRFLSSTKDVISAQGQRIGTIESEGGATFFKDNAGYVIAKNTRRDGPNYRLYTVTGCSNEKIGQIIETAQDTGGYRWSLIIMDADERTIGGTGPLDRWTDEYVIEGVTTLAKVSDNDRGINIMGPIDPRLVIMATAANREAGYEAANRQRRDNPREPGGRGGRDL